MKHAILIPGCGLADVDNQLANRGLADAGYARDRANGHPLAKEVNNFDAFGFVELVHAGHNMAVHA